MSVVSTTKLVLSNDEKMLHVRAVSTSAPRNGVAYVNDDDATDHDHADYGYDYDYDHDVENDDNIVVVVGDAR